MSNPPGRPTLTELPRYNTAAARVEWTPPLYTGGVADPWFNIRHRGLSISHTLIRGKSSVIDLLEFNQNSVSVGVASDDGTELSEWGVATSLFLYTALCGGELEYAWGLQIFCCFGSGYSQRALLYFKLSGL